MLVDLCVFLFVLDLELGTLDSPVLVDLCVFHLELDSPVLVDLCVFHFELDSPVLVDLCVFHFEPDLDLEQDSGLAWQQDPERHSAFLSVTPFLHHHCRFGCLCPCPDFPSAFPFLDLAPYHHHHLHFQHLYHLHFQRLYHHHSQHLYHPHSQHLYHPHFQHLYHLHNTSPLLPSQVDVSFLFPFRIVKRGIVYFLKAHHSEDPLDHQVPQAEMDPRAEMEIQDPPADQDVLLHQQHQHLPDQIAKPVPQQPQAVPDPKEETEDPDPQDLPAETRPTLSLAPLVLQVLLAHVADQENLDRRDLLVDQELSVLELPLQDPLDHRKIFSERNNISTL